MTRTTSTVAAPGAPGRPVSPAGPPPGPWPGLGVTVRPASRARRPAPGHSARAPARAAAAVWALTPELSSLTRRLGQLATVTMTRTRAVTVKFFLKFGSRRPGHQILLLVTGTVTPAPGRLRLSMFDSESAPSHSLASSVTAGQTRRLGPGRGLCSGPRPCDCDDVTSSSFSVKSD
jgi:hypothetical protein